MSDQTLPLGVKVLGATVIVAGVLIVCSFGALMLSSRSPAQELMTPLPYFEGVTVPDFEGVTQSNAPIDATMLDGQVTVVDFFFTHCPLVCPLMSTRMMEQAEKLAGTDVQFLSVSVDPENDTPEVMAEFSSRYDADESQWKFVQAPMEQVLNIGDAVGFTVTRDESMQVPLSPDETMANIIHPVTILLIGPDRKVYGRYHYKSDEDLDQLTRDARRLLGQR